MGCTGRDAPRIHRCGRPGSLPFRCDHSAVVNVRRVDLIQVYVSKPLCGNKKAARDRAAESALLVRSGQISSSSPPRAAQVFPCRRRRAARQPSLDRRLRDWECGVGYKIDIVLIPFLGSAPRLESKTAATPQNGSYGRAPTSRNARRVSRPFLERRRRRGLRGYLVGRDSHLVEHSEGFGQLGLAVGRPPGCFEGIGIGVERSRLIRRPRRSGGPTQERVRRGGPGRWRWWRRPRRTSGHVRA